MLDEANIIGAVDPDFHRRDIIESVKNGAYPEYELGVQLIPEKNEFKYDFDVLDSTKLWPEEEQSSFDPATLVPGIGVANDPVLQGRLFAYKDTDYHRLGTGNINEIPVNKPISEVNTNNRDSYSKYQIDMDYVTYHENSLADNTPAETPPNEGGYVEYPEKVEGRLTRQAPSESFYDYFSQARFFLEQLSRF